MSGEGAFLPNAGAFAPIGAPPTGAGKVPSARSGNILRRIARSCCRILRPRPQGFSDEQLREIDRRIVAVTRREQRRRNI